MSKEKDREMRVKIASKIYINNHSIGKTGMFPPHEITEGNKYFAPIEYGQNNNGVVLAFLRRDLILAIENTCLQGFWERILVCCWKHFIYMCFQQQTNIFPRRRISIRWKFYGSEEEIFFLCGAVKSPPHSRKRS